MENEDKVSEEIVEEVVEEAPSASQEEKTEGGKGSGNPIDGLSAKLDSIGTAIADLASSMKAGFDSMQDFAIAGGAAITDDESGVVEDDSSDYVPIEDLDLSI